jgi:hypothetical protein
VGTERLVNLANDGNEEDPVDFRPDRMLPVDEIAAHAIAQDVLESTGAGL